MFAGHDGFAAKSDHGIMNTRIVGGHDHTRKGFAGGKTFDDMLNQRLAGVGSKRFARKAGAGKAGGDDGGGGQWIDASFL